MGFEAEKNPSRPSCKKGKSTGIRSFELFIFLSLVSLAVLLSGCARKKVYIPPEYGSASPQPGYPAPQPPSAPPPQPMYEGPGISRTPEFKKQDIPASPPVTVQPAPQPVPQPAPKVQQSGPGKQDGAKSPQRQASMQLVNQARPSLDRGKPDTAIPLLEKAIQIDAKNAEAFMLLARAWKQKAARRKALEFARKAELFYQGQPSKLKEVYLLEADLYREMGESAKAAQYRQKASGLSKKRSE
ncbi:MAG: tetratricopeptide repeat protein [Syntrophobacteraceae bacterium]